MHDGLIAFGSNQGDPREIFLQAIEQLSRRPSVQVTATSQPRQTAAVGGPTDQPPFLNAAIRVKTGLSATELHQQMIAIETELGRERRMRWGARKIDLDLLLFDQLEMDTVELTIPHPRMSFRRFVLEPAREIAADLIHPTSGLTIDQLIMHLNQTPNQVLVIGHPDQVSVVSQLPAIPSGWAVQAISDLELFRQQQADAKLICYFGATQSTVPSIANLVTAAQSFPGPTLKLPLDRERSQVEILAALDAMLPVDPIRFW